MPWIKVNNSNRLETPPIFDKNSGVVNCHLNEEWLINNGYENWSDEQILSWNNEHFPPIQIDTTDFDRACSYFRQICGEIGTLMDDPNFKGGYDDMPIFYAHDSFKTEKGMNLAVAWAGCDLFCNHEAKKLGLGSPEWWYKCWEQQ